MENFDYNSAETKLLAIFKNVAAKKRQYDCMIPFSGGRDSSYVAYLCKQKFNLKPLLVTFNNLFMSEYALRNIFKIVEALDVDHIMLSYKPEKLKQYYRAMIIGGGEFCSICTAGINYAQLLCQAKFKIPLIIMGTSIRVDEQSPFEVNSTHPTYIRAVLTQNGVSEKDINNFLIPRQYEMSAQEKVKRKLMDWDFDRVNLPDYMPWDNQANSKCSRKKVGVGNTR